MSVDDQLAHNQRSQDMAENAIVAVLERIRDNETIRHEMGYGTASFAKLVTSYAFSHSVEPRWVAAQVLRCKPEELNPDLLRA
jgi:hypothetical protein